jgi:hypothetical protein
MSRRHREPAGLSVKLHSKVSGTEFLDWYDAPEGNGCCPMREGNVHVQGHLDYMVEDW